MTTCGYFFRTLRRSKGCDFSWKKYSQNSACLVKKIICLIFNKLTDLLIWATNLEAREPQLKCPRVQPCSPVVERGSAFFVDISKGMPILVNYPILIAYVVVILMWVLFWVAKESLCVTHLLVYYSLTEHLRLPCTHLLHTLLNFPLPLNIPVILSYTNTSRVKAFGRLLVLLILLTDKYVTLYTSKCFRWQ